LRSRLPGVTWVRRAVATGLRLDRARAFDLILSVAPPLYSHLTAHVLKRRLGIPWIAHWDDPDPIQLCPPPYGTGPAARLPRPHRAVLGSTAKNADAHIFPCERLAKYIADILPYNIRNRSFVVPHPVLENPCGMVLQAETGQLFELTHAGSLDSFRDPTTFLVGMAEFLKRCPTPEKIRLTLISGAGSYDYGELIRGLGLSRHVLRLGFLDYATVMRRLAMSTVLLIIEAPLREGIFFPSKFADYVQAGRPVLAVSPREGTLADYIKSYGGGLAADQRDPAQIAECISRLYMAWRSGTLEAEFDTRGLRKVFGENEVARRYDDLFGAVLKAS